MKKKIILLALAGTAGILFSVLQPKKLKSMGEESLGNNNPSISATAAEIMEETDNSLTIRYHLKNGLSDLTISACGDVRYASNGYSWGCKPVLIQPYAGSVDITYLLASTARSIECSDSVGVFFYIGRDYHFYQHMFAYEKIWHKNPSEESWKNYQERGCEEPKSVNELQHL